MPKNIQQDIRKRNEASIPTKMTAPDANWGALSFLEKDIRRFRVPYFNRQ